MRREPLHFGNIARSPGESVAPELWPAHAWVPSAGCTGDMLPDVSRWNFTGISSPGFSGDGFLVSTTTDMSQDGSFALGALDGFSIVMHTYWNTMGAWARMFVAGDSGTNVIQHGMQYDGASGRLQYAVNVNSAATMNSVQYTGFLGSENIICCASQKGTTDNVTININGETVLTGSIAVSAYTPCNRLRIGKNLSGSSFSNAPWTLKELYLYGRYLPPRDVESLNSDPCLPFRRRKLAFWSLPSGGAFKAAWARNATVLVGGNACA